MAFDFKKLRALMIEKYGSQTEFAKAYNNHHKRKEDRL